MSERTDDRTAGDDVDVEDLVDGGDLGAADDAGDVGFDDDELGVDVDALTDGPAGGSSSTGGPSAGGSASAPADAESSASSGESLRSRLTPSVGLPSPSAPDLSSKLPSGRSLLLTFVVIIGAMFAGSMVPLVGTLGGVLGIFAGALVLGLASGTRRYLPVTLAGAAAAAVSVVQGAFFRFAVLSDVPFTQFAAIGAATGVVAAVLGHYFGRDLRDGLTRDV